MNFNQRALLTAVIIAGIAIGLLSNIPLVSCVNCLLLAWVWLGAIGAVYIYRTNSGQPYLNTTQGLILGALAGAIGAIVGGIASIIFGGLSAAFSNVINNLIGSNTGVSIPNFILSTGFSIVGVIMNIILYAIVGAIGGLIATALIWKNPVPPQPPAPPYTPPPPPAGPVG